eukprot:scaffold16214_cov73-Phaeocystis_antarctica.AAC.4
MRTGQATHCRLTKASSSTTHNSSPYTTTGKNRASASTSESSTAVLNVGHRRYSRSAGMRFAAV